MVTRHTPLVTILGHSNNQKEVVCNLRKRHLSSRFLFLTILICCENKEKGRGEGDQTHGEHNLLGRNVNKDMAGVIPARRVCSAGESTAQILRVGGRRRGRGGRRVKKER